MTLAAAAAGGQSPARIGCVRYLNSKPLIHGHAAGVSFETPASLADGLHTGRLDVALAPIFELIAHPGYLVVDDVAIASRGPVYSVVIAYAGELGRLEKLYLDPASRTSANLQRVLLAEFYGLAPANQTLPADFAPETLPDGEGALLIGDLAIDFRARHGCRFHYLDLGEAWQDATGLPFVFAAWLMRPGLADPRTLADELRSWRAGGEADVEEVVREEKRYPASLTRRYLTEHIRFRLGAAEKQSIREYARLLQKHHLVNGPPFAEPRWT
jgi:chorismate dehydratase